MNLAPIRAKANAHYQCQECGSTELIQAHHEIPGDDDTLIALCAECHRQRHPDLPKALFFSTNNQPSWENISASSIARQVGCCSRTIIRRAKILGIGQGVLSPADLGRLKRKLPNAGIFKHCIPCNMRGRRMESIEIKEVRKKLKMPQQELADAIGVDRVTVARWETAQKRPSNLAKRQLARLTRLKGRTIGGEHENS